MSPDTREHRPAATPTQPQQPVGGSIIDAQGREIPITEQMVRDACKALEASRKQGH